MAFTGPTAEGEVGLSSDGRIGCDSNTIAIMFAASRIMQTTYDNSELAHLLSVTRYTDMLTDHYTHIHI